MMNPNHQRMYDQADRTLLAWMPQELPGGNMGELVRLTGLSERTITKHLRALIGRGKVIRTRVKKRVVVGVSNGTVREAIVSEWRYALKSNRFEKVAANG